MFRLSVGWTVLCQTVYCLDSTVSNCLMFGQYCVKLSNGWTVLFPTVQSLVSAVSNRTMVGQCCVLLSNGCTVLGHTVQWLDSAFSNCPMVGRCWIFCILHPWCGKNVVLLYLLKITFPATLIHCQNILLVQFSHISSRYSLPLTSSVEGFKFNSFIIGRYTQRNQENFQVLQIQ